MWEVHILRSRWGGERGTACTHNSWIESSAEMVQLEDELTRPPGHREVICEERATSRRRGPPSPSLLLEERVILKSGHFDRIDGVSTRTREETYRL